MQIKNSETSLTYLIRLLIMIGSGLRLPSANQWCVPAARRFGLRAIDKATRDEVGSWEQGRKLIQRITAGGAYAPGGGGGAAAASATSRSRRDGAGPEDGLAASLGGRYH